MDIQAALHTLQDLASSPSTSASGPLDALLEKHFAKAKSRLSAGDDPAEVIAELQKSVVKAKKEVEKGLKAWYGALGGVGKAVDKVRSWSSEQHKAIASRQASRQALMIGLPPFPWGNKRRIRQPRSLRLGRYERSDGSGYP